MQYVQGTTSTNTNSKVKSARIIKLDQYTVIDDTLREAAAIIPRQKI